MRFKNCIQDIIKIMRVQCAGEALRGKSKPHMQSEQLTCALRGQARKRGRTPGAYNADEKQ